MYKKILLSSAIAAAMGVSGTASAVNLDTNAELKSYAQEIDVTAAGLVLKSGTGGVLEAKTELGFSISQGQSKYVRIDISNAEFEAAPRASDLTLTDLVSETDYTVGVSQVDTDFVIYEIQAAVEVDFDQEIVFEPANGVTTENYNGGQLRYRLFDSGPAAIKEDTALQYKDITSTWFDFAPGVVAECNVGTPDRIDVVDPERWLNNNISTEIVAGVVFDVDTAVHLADGTAVAATDYFNGNDVVVTVDGSLEAFADDGNGAPNIAIGGTAASSVAAEFDSATFTGLADDAVVDDLTVTNDGTTEMVPTSFTVSVPEASGDVFSVGNVSASCGSILYSGSTDRLDFALTPDGAFKQYARITNPSGTPGAVTVTVINDAGQTVTFGIDQLDGIPAVLEARGSTRLIDINELYSAAQLENSNFGLTEGRGLTNRNKLRVEVRGEFGDDAVDANTATLTDRRADGIYIQGVTVSRDNNSFFQTK
ncbi:hypothetical protein [Marinobacter piscensis]|uniref:hypothetical protein n=1 Tax=Marinobacter piscensis TaxID=1562308 RepID=UPI0011A3A817|nr:hypothetical protein [Marinobacter piscensis]